MGGRRPFEIDMREYTYKHTGVWSFILRRRTVIFIIIIYLFIMSPRHRALCARVRRKIGGGRKSRENRRRFRRRRGRHRAYARALLTVFDGTENLRLSPACTPSLMLLL